MKIYIGFNIGTLVTAFATMAYILLTGDYNFIGYTITAILVNIAGSMIFMIDLLYQRLEKCGKDRY